MCILYFLADLISAARHVIFVVRSSGAVQIKIGQHPRSSFSLLQDFYSWRKHSRSNNGIDYLSLLITNNNNKIYHKNDGDNDNDNDDSSVLSKY